MFVALGILLVAWGAWVYAPANMGRGWAWRDGWGEGSAAANKSVSAFFPSRGDYDSTVVPPGRGYWAFHTVAILYMLSLAVAVFGVELVNRARVALRRRELNVVWGLGEEGRRIAEGLAGKTGKASVVFAVEEGGGGLLDLKESAGALRALTRDGWTWVLGRVGTPGSLGKARKHFFLGPDGYGNAARAEALLRALEKRCRRYMETTVYVRTWTDADDDAVHAWVDKWNKQLADKCVQVEAVREEAVVSRKFLQDHPMLDTPGVCVDTAATAVKGAFRVLVAGFGAQGRRLVAEMVADAQFLGPDGKPVPLEVDVADRDGTSWGWFQTECAEACRRYRIGFHTLDVRSAAFWSWLAERPAYNRVVLATQDDAVNLEAAGRVANAYRALFQEMRGMSDKTVSKTGRVVFARVRDHALSAALREAWEAKDGMGTAPYCLFGDTAETYEAKTLLNGRWSDGAVCFNGIWAAQSARDNVPAQGSAERVARDRMEWANASMFDKESSRASFFHQRNLLQLAGFTVFDGAPTDGELKGKGLIRVGPEQVKERIQEAGRLEKLSEMEHMRWMAFNLVRGWHRWTPTADELEALAKELNKAIKPNSLKKFAPLHADLVDYKDLKAVDELFNVVGRKHNWNEIKEENKDKDLVYGVEALFNAGFAVAEKLPSASPRR